MIPEPAIGCHSPARHHGHVLLRTLLPLSLSHHPRLLQQQVCKTCYFICREEKWPPELQDNHRKRHLWSRRFRNSPCWGFCFSQMLKHRAGFGVVRGTCHVIKQFWGRKVGHGGAGLQILPWSCSHHVLKLMSALVAVRNCHFKQSGGLGNPPCAHNAQICRCWQASPVFPAFPCCWLLLGSAELWRWG